VTCLDIMEIVISSFVVLLYVNCRVKWPSCYLAMYIHVLLNIDWYRFSIAVRL